VSELVVKKNQVLATYSGSDSSPQFLEALKKTYEHSKSTIDAILDERQASE
jgi:hypothetical protein